ncbi:hypothetical protein A2801_03090 [Candidatus Woesebacteria bacterium RIFCSPHIGHO2_01_FULL_41_10]|uniref:ATP synthase F1 subunit gamma n=1 Tax=Candidatus Woesebacteria bacterium RIFCSPHIGHO2_01_FULL_41_10 TaxID=1802500 RepID=A0A1F7YNQ0_9BACT|nr:MAG: hypothetical protein A2801_03090 [Candidatus Woesebacteria bacterium RIFCSPHIGHO2_01_FULL_41_10]
MSDIKTIDQNISQLTVFRTITQAYVEIAAIRMKRTRNSVLMNRDFLSRINDIFEDVRASYREEIFKLASGRRTRRGEDITFLAHNGKSVAVFLSANTGLYGDIIDRTFQEFLEDVRKRKSEATIIGKLGRSLFIGAEPDHPYTYYQFTDQGTAIQEFGDFVKHVVQYETIHVYYPSFKSAISQEPATYTISANTPLSDLNKSSLGKRQDYIFEPSLKEILMFFEREIFASQLDQTVREAQLAKYASRIISLDQAGENIKHELNSLFLHKLKVEHREANRKQLHSLASMNMWN